MIPTTVNNFNFKWIAITLIIVGLNITGMAIGLQQDKWTIGLLAITISTFIVHYSVEKSLKYDLIKKMEIYK